MNIKSVRFSAWLALLMVVSLAAITLGSTTTTTTNQFNTVWNYRVSGLMETTKTVNLACGGAICPAGTYQISSTMGVTAANAAGSATTTIAAHDGYASRSTASSAINTAAASGWTNSVLVLSTAGTGHMTAAFAITSVSGSPGMYVDISVRRLR